MKLKDIVNQLDDCPYCGDGIPKGEQMEQHISWCKPMIEKDKK